jgi:V/A-type H+-transporting ATPase subunit C
MRSPRSVYLITRVHGLRTHLLTPDDIQLLAKAGTLEQIADKLMPTEYTKDISRQNSGKIRASELEAAFLEKMVSRFFFISSISQKKFKSFVLAYARRFEVENIKRVIRAKYSGESVGQLIPLSAEQTSVNFKNLLEAGDLAEVMRLLSETAYAQLAESLGLYSEYKTTLVLESHLDKIYYDAVWQEAKKLKNKDIMHLIGMEIDTKNLITLVALKDRKVSPKLVDHLIIKNGSLGKRRLDSMAQAGIGEVQSFFGGTSYAEAAGKAAEALGKKMGMYKVEALLLAPLLKEVKSMMNKSLRLPYVISYLIKSEMEAKNLIAITMAKQLKLSVSLLQDILLI